MMHFPFFSFADHKNSQVCCSTNRTVLSSSCLKPYILVFKGLGVGVGAGVVGVVGGGWVCVCVWGGGGSPLVSKSSSTCCSWGISTMAYTKVVRFLDSSKPFALWKQEAVSYGDLSRTSDDRNLHSYVTKSMQRTELERLWCYRNTQLRLQPRKLCQKHSWHECHIISQRSRRTR